MISGSRGERVRMKRRALGGQGGAELGAPAHRAGFIRSAKPTTMVKGDVIPFGHPSNLTPSLHSHTPFNHYSYQITHFAFNASIPLPSILSPTLFPFTNLPPSTVYRPITPSHWLQSFPLFPHFFLNNLSLQVYNTSSTINNYTFLKLTRGYGGYTVKPFLKTQNIHSLSRQTL